MKSFEEIYEKVSKECSLSMESMKTNVTIMVIASSFILIMMGSFASVLFKNYLFILIPLLIIFIYIIILIKNRKDEKQFKEKVMKEFIKQYNEEFTYDINKGTNKQIYLNSGLEQEEFNIFETEDCVTGNRFEISEIFTKKQLTNEKINKILFYGLFSQIDLDKKVQGKIKVLKKKAKQNKEKEDIKDKEKEFEKIYDVYFNNQEDEIKVLTKEVKKLILEFKQKNKIAPELVIEKNKLYIRFETGNVFEKRMFKKSINEKALLKYYNILNLIFDLTDEINKK